LTDIFVVKILCQKFDKLILILVLN